MCWIVVSTGCPGRLIFSIQTWLLFRTSITLNRPVQQWLILADFPGIWHSAQCHTTSPTLGVSVALWVWAISGLAGVNVGAVSEFLFLVLPGLVPGLEDMYVGAVYIVAVGTSSLNVFVNHL